MADLSAVEFEGVEAKGFRGGEAIGARRRAAQAFFEEVKDGIGPVSGVVAAGAVWRPAPSLFLSARAGVMAGQDIEAARGEAELIGCFGRGQGVLLEGFEDMADEGRGVTMEELLRIFMHKDYTGVRPPRPAISSAFATLR
ncbi:MAG: hypothetical protein ACRD1I_08980, partial [Terriglobia bacterium]